MKNIEVWEISFKLYGLLDTITRFCKFTESIYNINPEFSFGHIVLSDYNLDNSAIDVCLTNDIVKGWYQGMYEDGERNNWGVYRYQSLCDAKVLIIEFLIWLKTIPEDIRDEVGY